MSISSGNQPLVSLCMIVKNEEATLQRCLDSCQGLVDEMIVVDTGSTDRTRDIAAAAGAQVYDFAWVNDFSAARNESLRHATGTWILYLDADEYLQEEKKEEFRTVLQAMRQDAPIAFILSIVNFLGASSRLVTNLLQSKTARLFRNDKGMHFENAIHEQLVCSEGDIQYVEYSFNIYHTGYTVEEKTKKNKSERNMELHKAVKKEKGGFDRYYSFTLGNEYANVDNYSKAIYYYEKAEKGADPQTLWYPLCMERLTVSYMQTKRLRNAEQLIMKGIGYYPSYIDMYYYQALLLLDLGFVDDAEHAINEGFRVTEAKRSRNEQYWLTSPDYGGIQGSILYSRIYSTKLDLEKTIFYLSRGLSSNPLNFGVAKDLLLLLKQKDEPAAILRFFQSIYPMESHLVFFAYHLGITTGFPELARVYYEQLAKNGFVLSPMDALTYRLVLHEPLQKDASMLEEQREWSEDDMKFLVLGGLVDRDAEWLRSLEKLQLEHWTETLRALVGLLDGQAAQSELISTQALLMMIEAVKLGYFELYDQLIGYFADSYYVNQMGHYFFNQFQTELAFDYYGMLLQHGALDGAGYLNVARVYLQQADTKEEGISLLKESIALHPDPLHAYVLYCLHAKEGEERKRMKERLIDRYPEFKEISVIKSL